MNRNRFFLLMLVVALFGFQSCQEKDDEDNKPQSNLKSGEVENIDATDYSKWVYVSLETGKVVGTGDLEQIREGDDWDIAFHRYNVRLNGGKSGSGKAGAYLAPGKIGKTGWDAIVTAPNDGYVADKMTKIMKEYKMPPVMVDASASPVITGGKAGTWLKMDMSSMPPTYSISNQIFIIKTAKGKYGKLWIKQYLGIDGKGGHITFKYAYQENGSKDLK